MTTNSDKPPKLSRRAQMRQAVVRSLAEFAAAVAELQSTAAKKKFARLSPQQIELFKFALVGYVDGQERSARILGMLKKMTAKNNVDLSALEQAVQLWESNNNVVKLNSAELAEWQILSEVWQKIEEYRSNSGALLNQNRQTGALSEPYKKIRRQNAAKATAERVSNAAEITELNKAAGRLGGIARSEVLTPEQRRAIALKGSAARWKDKK